MIREITIDDISLYNKLGNELNDNFEKLFDLEGLLNNKYNKILGYYESNILRGFIHITMSFEVFDIVNIIVQKEYR